MTYRASLTRAITVIAMLVAGAANASVINYSGASVDMGTVTKGQTGDVTNNTFGATFPPYSLLSGSAYGFLPSDTEITFTYTFSNLVGGYLQSYGSYDYTTGSNTYKGSAVDNTSTGTVETGSTNGASTAPLVLASANLSGVTTGTTTIVNTSAGLAQFQTLFTGLFASGGKITSLNYTVSSVPLPAALPMFAAVIAGLFGLSWARKRKLAA